MNTDYKNTVHYKTLRAEVFDRLPALAGSTWTDYNTHDPGITALEILCYAISDICYRTGFDIEDILSSLPDDASPFTDDFHRADQLLHNAPLSDNDYRKLLIDIPGIRNAWLETATKEEPFLFYRPDDRTIVTSSSLGSSDTATRIVLDGLFSVRLELAEHEELQDLNSNAICITLTEREDGTPVEIFLHFPYWQDLPEWARKITSSDTITTTVDGDVTAVNDHPDVDPYKRIVERFFCNLAVTVNGDSMTETIPVRIRLNPVSFSGEPKPVLWPEHTTYSDKITDWFISSGPDNPLLLYLRKIRTINAIIVTCRTRLMRNRNLCEDPVAIEMVKTQTIAITTTLNTPPGNNPAEALCDAFYALDAFLSPYVNPRNPRELIEDEGMSAEDAYEGPFLDHGHIGDDELETIKRNNVLYTSDLIHCLMDLESVLTTGALTMSCYINDQLVVDKADNCMRLAALYTYKPRFSPELSRITIRQGGVVTEITPEMREWVLTEFHRRKSEAENAAVAISESEQSIPPVTGQSYDLQEFISIQEDFPALYGIGEQGLPADANAHRKAQARQLQGFLLLFDQVLANAAARLVRLRKTLSFDPAVCRTGFYQTLYAVPGIAALLNPEEVSDTWDTFAQNPINSYATALRNACETPQEFYRRRIAILNHLAARYAEESIEYDRLMNVMYPDYAGSLLVRAKTTFLNEYPRLSSRRAQAFDYYLYTEDGTPDVWNSKNVSGFEHRVCRLLGMTRYDRRSLADEMDRWEFSIEPAGTASSSLYMVDPEGRRRLEAPHEFSDESSAVDHGERLLDSGCVIDNYKPYTAENGFLGYNIIDADGTVLATSSGTFFTSYDALEQEMHDTLHLFVSKKLHIDQEGFHLIEHILLRPRSEERRPFSLHPTPCSPTFDPYSFQVSIIIPNYVGRLQKRDFQNHVARVMNEELPAHIVVNIIWLDRISLKAFEAHYYNWLRSDIFERGNDHANNLIEFLNTHLPSVKHP